MWRNAIVIMVTKVKQIKLDIKTFFRRMTTTPRLRFDLSMRTIVTVHTISYNY